MKNDYKRRSVKVSEKDGFDSYFMFLKILRGYEPKVRHCLRCGGDFYSEGKYNRICDGCKKLEETMREQDILTAEEARKVVMPYKLRKVMVLVGETNDYLFG